MIVDIGTFIPLELPRDKVVDYFVERSWGIKQSLLRIRKTSERLIVRCPLAGDYVSVSGDKVDVTWVDKQLKKKDLYKIKS